MPKDVFDYYDEDDTGKSKSKVAVWDILAIVMIVGALCLAAVFLMIIINPYSGLNPFPPPTMPVLAPTLTPSPTLRALLPPTWTPTPSPLPTETATPEPTYTLTPEGAQPTLEGTRDPSEGMPFVIQDGYPQYIPNIYHPDAGCNWQGIGGQVSGLNGGPVLFLSIKLGGSLNGQAVNIITISGTAPQYGQAGFEFTLGEQPVDSVQSLYVELLDQADLPLSEKIYFDTINNCEKNLILINFKQLR
ncbi:MAG TPA: hypothetical protein DEH25_13340 [Chloroflexi bacterium]|nr:hypothetical protein [Chloroflexota bacterium]HBY09017.1 hypothetical protein [Chloroflexota bacterium]